MLYFVVVFVEDRILIFHVLFLSLFFSCLYRDRPFFCAAGMFVFVCVCAGFTFLLCWVLFVIKERKGKMLYFVDVFVEVRILILHVYFYLCSFLVFTGIGHSSEQSVCLCLFVCWLDFHFVLCWVLFVIKEGKGEMLYFVVVFVEVRI